MREFIITILFVSISSFALSQTQPKKETPAPVTPNQIQVQKLSAAYKEASEVQLRINELTELIIGYKLDEVDSLRVENGQFKFVLKPKKK